MKAIFIIVGLFFFNGCDVVNKPRLSNQEIIKRCKECEDAGLRAVPYFNVVNAELIDIVCYPKRGK